MSPPPVAVEPKSFQAASTTFATMAERLGAVATSTPQALAGTGAMAGSDNTGTTWAAAYDPAAAATAGSLVDLANASYKLAGMLALTGFNHGRAEDASDPTGTRPTEPDTTDHTPPATLATTPAPPTASGGSTEPPTGWDLVQAAVGYLWPDGDPAKLRAAAAAWTKAADGLKAAGSHVPVAIQAISQQKSQEMGDALTVCNAMTRHVDDVAAACGDLATACTGLAADIETAHQDVEDELISLLEWTVGIEAAGAIAGLVTVGVAEVPAQAVEGARIAATAARIGEIISHLIELAGTAGRAVNAVIGKVADVVQRLRTILGALLSRATAAVVERLPGAAKDAETLAEQGLARRGCFAAGTVVHGPAGPRPIETVAVGDLVLATDPDTGAGVDAVVTATFTRTVDLVVEVTVGGESGESIVCSPEHPFWVAGVGWTPAGQLVAGVPVVDAARGEHVVDAVDVRHGTVTVHNIEVAGAHTYHVSALAILVHNKAMFREPVNPKRVDAKFLKRKGVDPHSAKLADLGPMKYFDIYLDETGALWQVRKGLDPKTYAEYLGDLEWFKN